MRERLVQIQRDIGHDLMQEQPGVDLATISLDGLVQPTAAATPGDIVVYFLSSLYLGANLLSQIVSADATAALDEESEKTLEQAVRVVDTAVILTGVVVTRVRSEHRNHDRNLYTQVLGPLLSHLPPLQPLPKVLPRTFPDVVTEMRVARYPMDRIGSTDFEQFQLHILASDPQSLAIPALALNWLAIADGHWGSPRFWAELTCGGHRLVPAERGRSYTDSDWSVALVPFAEILAQMLALPGALPRAAEICYMAQYNLADQFPRLALDVLTPDFCHAFYDNEDSIAASALIMNIWLGPAGTVSPLHRDPAHNVYVQVVGSKYFRLYPKATAVYADPTATGTTTTSTVDLDDDTPENRRRYPNFDWDTGYRDIVLGPGDALFIPRGWWHYVRSLSSSIGVNFWF
jgi:lysine-specific demethylase 8